VIVFANERSRRWTDRNGGTRWVTSRWSRRALCCERCLRDRSTRLATGSLALRHACGGLSVLFTVNRSKQTPAANGCWLRSDHTEAMQELLL
jgi:hypothetical protein